MLASDTKTGILHCSFCGKDQDNVAKLIAGPKINICDECVWLCMCITADLPDDTPDQLHDEVVAFMRERCEDAENEPRTL